MITLVNFYSYNGMAGDLQELLVGVSSTGIRESTLYTRTGLFKNYCLKRAKKRLFKQLKKKTGLEHKEITKKESL